MDYFLELKMSDIVLDRQNLREFRNHIWCGLELNVAQDKMRELFEDRVRYWVKELNDGQTIDAIYICNSVCFIVKEGRIVHALWGTWFPLSQISLLTLFYYLKDIRRYIL